MLTAYQCETIAGVTEYGTILCLDCASDEYVKALIRYNLDEEQVSRSEGYYEDADGHAEDCECLPVIECENCGAELVEEYVGSACEEKEE